jgi:hypothetical protein
MMGLRELNVAVVHDLEVVAPRVEKVVAADRGAGFTGGRERPLAAVDDEAEMAVAVRRLRSPLRERDELVAHVDERHPATTPAKPEVEDAAVERERLLDVTDLEGDVVDADEARAVGHGGMFAR